MGIVVGLSSLLVLAVVLAQSDDSGPAIGSPTATVTSVPRTASPTVSASPVAANESPTATETPAIEFSFQIWSRSDGRWRSDALAKSAGFKEGETAPLLVRIDGAVVGDVYEINFRYQCRTKDAAAIDFIDGIQAKDSGALLAEPAAKRPRPDATLPIPTDPSIKFDDGAGRLFRVWGVNFHQPPVGPSPRSKCQAQKELSLTLKAFDDVVFLVVGAHLSRAADWGAGNGMSSQRAAVSISASVNGLDRKSVQVSPGAVSP